MKNTKICPKCCSQQIVKISGGKHDQSNNFAIGYPSYAKIRVDRYCCLSCGYSEEYINKQDINLIQDALNSKLKLNQ